MCSSDLFGSALSFVGAGYPNRQEFMQGLLDFDLKIWGSDWKLPSPLTPVIQDNAARVVEADIVKIFNASRINLNLHSSPFHQGINPDGDYLNPRIFDFSVAGAFQLVDWRAQLPGFFSPDRNWPPSDLWPKPGKKSITTWPIPRSANLWPGKDGNAAFGIIP